MEIISKHKLFSKVLKTFTSRLGCWSDNSVIDLEYIFLRNGELKTMLNILSCFYNISSRGVFRTMSNSQAECFAKLAIFQKKNSLRCLTRF